MNKFVYGLVELKKSKGQNNCNLHQPRMPIATLVCMFDVMMLPRRVHWMSSRQCCYRL
jgi:hypothetical protein